MTSNLPGSDRYSSLIQDTTSLLELSWDLLDEGALRGSAGEISKARRIFCMGSGSSRPAAQFLAAALLSKGALTAQVLGLSEFLSVASRGPEDLLILVSQGLNRADAAIAVTEAVRTGMKLIVITSSDATLPDGAYRLRFSPTYQDERVFCRPVGVISSLVVAQRILGILLSGERCTKEQLPTLIHQADALRSLSDRFGGTAATCDRVVVLGSGTILPAAGNIALALREGAGVDAECFEIEFYAHGQYAAHLRRWNHGSSLTYLLLSAFEDRISERAAQRISPLLKGVGVPTCEWRIPGDPFTSNLILLRLGSLAVQTAIQATGYDMNNPIGKEENRGFQEVGSHYYNDLVCR